MEKKNIKIEIKNRWTGVVLFEYEKENNTIKRTMEEAVKKNAYLGGAYLRGAGLGGAKDIPYIPMSCPTEGAFIGWKKVKDGDFRYIVKLQIFEDSRRSSSTGRKCRCDKAGVLEIYDMDEPDNKPLKCENRSYNQLTVYEVGKTVIADSFDENRWNECSHGIHFFISREEAEQYGL